MQVMPKKGANIMKVFFSSHSVNDYTFDDIKEVRFKKYGHERYFHLISENDELLYVMNLDNIKKLTIERS